MKPALRMACDGQRGVALLVTLMMVSVLTMMVVGLAGVMRNEQAAARNLTFQVLAEQVAEIGVAEAMAAVLSNSPTGPNPGFTATGPGWAFQNQPPAAFLFSTNTNAGVKNLEMFGTNSMILSLPATTPRVDGFVAGGWVPLFRPNETNAFARYAWWVDDEASKLNLNLTGSNDPSLAALSTRTPFATNWVFVNPASGQAFTPFTNRLAFRTNVFWSAESVKDLGVYGTNTNMPLTAAQYRQIKGNITAWSLATDLTPWGTPKVNLNDPAVTSATISNSLANSAWTNLFGSQTWAAKFGGASNYVLSQLVANLQAVRGGAMTNTNLGSGVGLLRHRASLPLDPMPMVPGTSMINEVAVSVTSFPGPAANQLTAFLQLQVELVNPYASRDTNTYTLEVLPRKFRFHVACLQNPPTGGASISPLTRGGTTIYSRLDSTGTDAGIILGCWMGPMMENGTPWPTNDISSVAVNGLAAKSYQVVTLSPPPQFSITVSAPAGNRPVNLSQAYVQLDWVRLRRGSQIVDWVSMDDFSQSSNFRDNNTSLPNDHGQMNFTLSYPFSGSSPLRTTPVPNTNQPAPAQAQGLAKNDPRVRLPMQVWDPLARGVFQPGGLPNTVRAWKRVRGNGAVSAGGAPLITLGTGTPLPGAHNGGGVYDGSASGSSVTGISALMHDPAPGVTDITNHPHFMAGYAPTNGFTSIAQLGAIHTGLPWRTLRLQPTPALELAQGPPDWTLLEVFTLSGSSGARPMFNVNSAMLGMVRSGNQWTQGLVTNSLGQIQARPWAFLGAMGPVGTNLNVANIDRAISNGIPVSLTNGAIPTAVLTNLAGNLTNALMSPTNPAVWSVNSGWGGYRAANTNRFPSRGLLLRGEILEVRGLAEDTNATATAGEDLLEGRPRLFLDMMTTRSDTFSVWSVGQGLSVFTNARGRVQTNVMGEVRQQTVFQRVPVVQNGVTTEYRVERLYSRTHTLEELAAEDLR